MRLPFPKAFSWLFTRWIPKTNLTRFRVKIAAESSRKSFYNLVIDKLPSTYVLCHARSIQLEGYWLLSSKRLPSRCSTVHLKPHLYKGGLTCMGGDQQATHRTLYKLLIFIHPPPLRRVVSFFNAICNPFASLMATQQHLLWGKIFWNRQRLWAASAEC